MPASRAASRTPPRGLAPRAPRPDEPAAVAQPRRAGQLVADVRAQRLDLLALGLLVGKEALGHAHCAEAPGAGIDRVAVADARELHGAAAEVERHALGQRGRVDRRQVAVTGLLAGGQHLELEARALLGAGEEVVAV